MIGIVIRGLALKQITHFLTFLLQGFDRLLAKTARELNITIAAALYEGV